MDDYTELIRALRFRSRLYTQIYAGPNIMSRAADAIEELSKERIKGNCPTCARSSDMCGDETTRCPIEEHYALPLDGYCHLYEPKEKT